MLEVSGQEFVDHSISGGTSCIGVVHSFVAMSSLTGL